MTDTPTDVEDVDEPGAVYCRHCGKSHDLPASVLAANPDWLCPHCERYQDAVICPTCKQLARASLLSADSVPAPHARVRRKAK